MCRQIRTKAVILLGLAVLLLPSMPQLPPGLGGPGGCGWKGDTSLVGLRDLHAVDLRHPAPSSGSPHLIPALP